MDDPIIEAIRRGNEEEIRAELHEERMRKLPGEIMEALRDAQLSASLTQQNTEESNERLQTINANIYELHNTLKDVRGSLRLIAISSVAIALMIAMEVFK